MDKSPKIPFRGSTKCKNYQNPFFFFNYKKMEFLFHKSKIQKRKERR